MKNLIFIGLISVFLVALVLPNRASAINSAENFLTVPKYPLTEIDFNSLIAQDEAAIIQLTNALVTVGAIQITGIPNFEFYRESALKDLSKCLQTQIDVTEVIMNDGSIRRSTGAQSVHGIPGEMDSICGKSSAKLRALSDNAVKQLLHSLDAAKRKNSEGGMLIHPYRDYEDILSSGDHLEHLHSYYPSSVAVGTENLHVKYSKNLYGNQKLDEFITMPLHSDDGLFIAMTTGYYSDQNGQTSDENGLFLQLSTGDMVRVSAKDSSLIFMIGEGGSKWLAPLLGAPLRSVPHALMISLRGSSSNRAATVTRSWFGKMYLPPANAIIDSKTQLTYGQYRRNGNGAGSITASQYEDIVVLPTACGGVSSQRIEDNRELREFLTNTLCEKNGEQGVNCWTQCYVGSELPYCGLEAECVDTATGEIVDGTINCPSEAGMDACALECNGIESNSTDDGYCYGAGMVMYMDGFTSITSRTETECLNLLFTEWTLDNSTKFAMGCVGVFLLAVFSEALKAGRMKLALALNRTERSQVLKYCGSVFLIILHGIQILLGYLLMLAAMTFSIEIFSTMLAGLTIGYGLFNFSLGKSASVPEGGDCHDVSEDPLLQKLMSKN